MAREIYEVEAPIFKHMLETNLTIRHHIASLLPYLKESDLKRYQEFFRYTERLDKKIYVTIKD